MQNTFGVMDPQALTFSMQTSNHPRIGYFVSRNNNTLVPLIPVDELPYNIRLYGVSRQLRLDQTHGMQHIGTLPFTGATFKLEGDITPARSTSQSPTSTHSRTRSSSPTAQFLPPDALARQAMANAAGNDVPQHALPPRPMSAHELATTQWRKTPVSTSSDKTQAVIDAIVGVTKGPDAVGTNNTVLPPSGKLPDPSKKTHCHYWIKTGQCDFMQQGCIYLHEMPTLNQLNKMYGMTSIPRWWLEKNQKVRMTGVKSTLAEEKKAPFKWPSRKDTQPKLTSGDGDSTSSGSDAGSEKSEPEDLKTLSIACTGAATPSPPSVPSTPPSSQIDQLSDADDLIDLSDEQVTTKPSPTSTEKVELSTKAKKQESSAKITDSKNAPEPASKDNAPIKVFVPAGESPEVHIEQAKKRARRPVNTSSRTTETTETLPLQKQIQTLQKSKHRGLLASKYACPNETSSPPKTPSALTRKQVPAKRNHAVPIRSPEQVAVKVPGGQKAVE